MTKEQALYKFWSSFGTAYAEGRVPTGSDAPQFPYITFQVATDSFDNEVSLNASLWDRDSNRHNGELANNLKTEEISKAIGRGGTWLRCDSGAIWIKKGHPFAQSMGDDSDDKVRRKLLNITAEYTTAD